MGGTIDDEVKPGRHWWEYRPVSHAAAYAEMDETNLAAVSDVNEEKLTRFADRYAVPAEHRYTDYKQMVAVEDLDILSVTTPADSHAAITVYAAEQGVSGIYCEKAMACSMTEADAMREACRSGRVVFNLGTSRRYHPGFGKMREIIESGRIGKQEILVFRGSLGPLLHSGSHVFDTLLYLLGDPELESVQGRLRTIVYPNDVVGAPRYDALQNRFCGRIPFECDAGIDHATIVFKSGLRAQLTRVESCAEYEVFGSDGSIAFNNFNQGWIRPALANGSIDREPFPAFEPESFTKCIIRNLIESIETGTLGHLEVSHRGMEIAMALAQSHVEGGRLVRIPMSNRSLLIPNH